MRCGILGLVDTQHPVSWYGHLVNGGWAVCGVGDVMALAMCGVGDVGCWQCMVMCGDVW